MRVLVVTNLFPTPRRPHVGVFVARQVESLRAVGIEIDVVHLDRKQHGRRVYRGLAKRIHESLVSSDSDLVHVMYGGVMADVVTRTVRDRPVLVSFCGSDLLAGGATTLVSRLSWGYGVLASRRAASRADGIVVKSNNLRDALPKGIDGQRVWILPSGVDLSTFAPRDRRACQEALRWDTKRKHVLFPSSPDRSEKRFDLARAAADLVNGQHGEVELHTFPGIPHEDVPVWLNASDVVLLTSEHEGSPNAIKEALACNVPIVSVDVGDVRERIEAIDGCFLTDAAPASIATGLARALAMGGRIDGRERVTDVSLERVAHKLVDIYGTLASRRAST